MSDLLHQLEKDLWSAGDAFTVHARLRALAQRCEVETAAVIEQILFRYWTEGPVEEWRPYVEPMVIELLDRGSPIGARLFERALELGKTPPFALYGKPYDALLGRLASDAAAPLSVRERAMTLIIERPRTEPPVLLQWDDDAWGAPSDRELHDTCIKLRRQLQRCGLLHPQPESDWNGPFPLPRDIVDFYRHVGPLLLPGSGFFPLSELWNRQAGYRWNSESGERLVGWSDDWLVIADSHGDPYVYSLASGTVLFARHGQREWKMKRKYKRAWDLWLDMAKRCEVLPAE